MKSGRKSELETGAICGIHPSVVTRFLLMGAISALLLALAVSTLLAGKKSKKEVSSPASRIEDLVWPAPPQPARIRFIRQILNVDDVLPAKKKRGWMDRLAGVKPQEEKTHLSKPYGVAVDSKGRIYVADAANRAVLVFDLNNDSVEFRGQRGSSRLAVPIGVAVDDRDRLFVSDSFLHQINCYSPEGDLLAVFGGDRLKRPAGVAIDDQRQRLYVADAKGMFIGVFDIDSYSWLRSIGSASAPGEEEEGKFAAPTNVAVDQKGFLYVTDTWDYRIQIFKPDGTFERAFGEQGVVPGTFVRPKGVAVDSDGHVYVADAEFNNFQILTPEGRPLMAVGSFGIEPGQFTLIAGIAIDRNNRVYVTDQWSGRLQIFEYIPEKSVAASGAPRP